jgi:deoxyribonuclease-1
MIKKYLFYLLLLTFVCTRVVNATSPNNFDEAKKVATVIWSEHRETFYCPCPYDKYGIIDFKRCGYVPEDRQRDKRISWEHVVPVSWYGAGLDCWKKPICKTKKGKKFKGRNCCRKISPTFRKMEADLHNLVPTIREVNSARENYQFQEFNFLKNKEKFNFNECSIIIDERYRLFEPPDNEKGMIARISLYMADKYGIDLGERQYRMLTDWNNRFPVSDWERRWNEKVALIDGEHNSYIKQTGAIE